MPALDLVRFLEESGAVLRGHFLLASGRHSDTYIEKFRILEKPEVLTVLCRQIAEHFSPTGVDMVAGPTTGGIIIAFEVARQLGCHAVYVESENGERKLRRGATIPPGARVLVVDDVLTTGKSVLETMDALTAAGATIAGVGVLIDRSEADIPFPAPTFAACRISATSYAPDDLPPALAGIPIVKPGTSVTPT